MGLLGKDTGKRLNRIQSDGAIIDRRAQSSNSMIKRHVLEQSMTEPELQSPVCAEQLRKNEKANMAPLRHNTSFDLKSSSDPLARILSLEQPRRTSYFSTQFWRPHLNYVVKEEDEENSDVNNVEIRKLLNEKVIPESLKVERRNLIREYLNNISASRENAVQNIASGSTAAKNVQTQAYSKDGMKVSVNQDNQHYTSTELSPAHAVPVSKRDRPSYWLMKGLSCTLNS